MTTIIFISYVQSYKIHHTKYMTQYNKRYILSIFENIDIFALPNRRFNKLSNDTKFAIIEVVLLKIQVLLSVNFLLFS